MFLKNSETVDNQPIEIFVSKNGNRNTFKIKNEYLLELLTLETIKLLGSTKIKITGVKNGESFSHLEVVELVLIHCNIVDNNYQQNSKIL